jgi:hypothetical protein
MRRRSVQTAVAGDLAARSSGCPPPKGKQAMAFDGIAHVKEAYERLQGRMRSIRKEGERVMQRGFAMVEINGAALAMGYANERWGDPGTGDGAAFNEITVLGIPADLGGSIAIVATALLGGLGLYEEHGFNVGNGLSACFSSRFGMELGRKARSAAPKTKTSGAPAEFGPGAVPAGRRYHVEYAQG